MLAPLAIPMLVYYQKSLLARSSGCALIEQEFLPALVNLLQAPPGLREKPLQALRFPSLRSGHGLGVGKGCKGLVESAAGSKSPSNVAAETFALGASSKMTADLPKLSEAHLIEVARSISTHQRSRVWVHLESML